MREKQPNPANFCERIDYNFPLIGFYDAPDPAPFVPLIEPEPGDEYLLEEKGNKGH